MLIWCLIVGQLFSGQHQTGEQENNPVATFLGLKSS